MQLVLLRHGDSIVAGYDDVRRPLSPLGERQAAAAAKFLLSFGPPVESILSSPFERTQKTAEIIAGLVGIRSVAATEYLVPGTAERQLIDQLNGMDKAGVLLVGHEPQLRSFLSHLLTGSRGSLFEFRPGSMACVASTSPLEPGKALLRWLVNYEQLQAIPSLRA
jgi:phosphohistidine phosphatase